ncbi:hypothetical protein KJ891_04265 [Candidatus Micrarchaeota archaeon]|nr:hypothetical protein [Candidatus Micrarchaeota archaeon]
MMEERGADAEAEKLRAERQRRLEGEMQLSAMMRNLLEDDARERLNNVRLVNSELYYRAAQGVVLVAQQRRQGWKMSEAEMRGLLEKLSGKRETVIKRK